MAGYFNTEPMLEMYLFETGNMVDQLEKLIINADKAGVFSHGDIDEIFRIMHTIKGSSAMMMYDNISTLAHSIEDVFFFLREKRPTIEDNSQLSDLVLEFADFVKLEMEKIKEGLNTDGDISEITKSIKTYLDILKGGNDNTVELKSEKVDAGDAKASRYYISPETSQAASSTHHYHAVVYFTDGCEMENIRAYTIIHSLKDLVKELYYIPENIIEDDSTAEVIKNEGFHIFFSSESDFKDMEEYLFKTILFLKQLILSKVEESQPSPNINKPLEIKLEDEPIKIPEVAEKVVAKERDTSSSVQQTMISVHVGKLDKLMDLVGELVISEAMVTQNPDLKGLVLDNFYKSARQLQKITVELQDTVMSIRMVPLATTFHKMHRIVRDMCKKLTKEVELELIGEETEVDKNIIEHISDPLMHIIRNSLDHGIETLEERRSAGKSEPGKIILEARNSGSDVLIIIRDNGRGLNKEKIIKRAKENGLILRPESELTDKEIYAFIFAPGFSTKEKITEFSGRGVGMDVVVKNIGSVGGSVLVDSVPGEGTTITLKIPLTLAIIDGMTIGVGASRYTLPITAIKESFKADSKNIIIDPDGNEMIMVRGQCFPILRIHKAFKVKTGITELTEGILIMVESETATICLFADKLIGEQQVVVKALPQYIKNLRNIKGLAGCTLLGDGSISLIIDVGGIMNVGYSS